MLNNAKWASIKSNFRGFTCKLISWMRKILLVPLRVYLLSWGVNNRGRFGLDTIRFLIRSSRYNTFNDTFVVLGWKAETYNDGLRSGAPHSTCYCCLRSNHGQWVQQWGPHLGFQVQCFCVEFLHFIGIYWLLSGRISCSFLTIARDVIVSYRIVISLSVSRYIHVLSAQIYRCTRTMMNHFTPVNNLIIQKNIPQKFEKFQIHFKSSHIKNYVSGQMDGKTGGQMWFL